MPPVTKRVVFLDIDNTILDFEACSRRAADLAVREGGIDPALFDYRVFSEVNNELWASLERGEIERETIHKTRWGIVFGRLGIEADGEAFEDAFLEAVTRSVVPVAGAEDLLIYLSARYRVIAASNAPHEQQLLRLKSAGLSRYFEEVFTSELLGAAKPSRAFFDGVFARLDGVLPEECVMIGDSLTADILGAAAYGMETVWFNFKGADVPEACPADFTVAHLSEIRRIL